MIIGIQQTVSIILNQHVIIYIDDIRKHIFNKLTSLLFIILYKLWIIFNIYTMYDIYNHTCYLIPSS